uniref:Uncharacterized protein n=1 Tax=Lotus japonicus TaxID=34305 RepID=I3S9X9_LOTJA|nr:unknown [Lotus japonicus]
MPNQGIRGGIVGLSADQGMNGNLAQGGGIGGLVGLMGGNNRIPGASDDPIVSLQNSTNLPLNANGFRSPNQQQQMQNSHQQNHQQQQHPSHLLHLKHQHRLKTAPL